MPREHNLIPFVNLTEGHCQLGCNLTLFVRLMPPACHSDRIVHMIDIQY
jgi:hypothetical protein